MLLGLSTGPTGWVVAFAAGMVSFLSPCVLPMVPGYLSLMSGVSVTEVVAGSSSDVRRLVRSTLLFVAGFTVVFTALGATASAVGSALLEHQRTLNAVAGVVVIVMGLFLAGMVSPRLLQQERRFHVVPSKLGVFAAPVMGMAFAFGWTPCIGAVLAPILTYAAADGTVTSGVVLLVFYSLGLGVPFVLSGVAFGRLAGAFGWVKRHFRVINVVSGLLLAGFGLLLLTNQVGQVSGMVLDAMDRLGLDFLTTS
ncbi:MAG TPA: cytochrome c biogenesis protein CcdA [Acidimicrobiales bacterium]|nr:cytochrome c biogenesis protein CcdA [Acidimicrobiales bacterium]